MNSEIDCDFVLERVDFADCIVLDKSDHFYTCGRGRENQIVCASVIVSRKHCVFFRKNGELFVRDLGSSNGLYINGKDQKAEKTIQVFENDIIGIGCPDIDVNNDATKFVYRLRIRKHTVTDQKEIGDNTETPSDNQELACREKDSICKRKTKQNCDSVVPTKIPKLNDKVTCCSTNSKETACLTTAADKLGGITSMSENMGQDIKSFYTCIKDEIEIIDISTQDSVQKEDVSSTVHSNENQVENPSDLNKYSMNRWSEEHCDKKDIKQLNLTVHGLPLQAEVKTTIESSKMNTSEEVRKECSVPIARYSCKSNHLNRRLTQKPSSSEMMNDDSMRKKKKRVNTSKATRRKEQSDLVQTKLPEAVKAAEHCTLNRSNNSKSNSTTVSSTSDFSPNTTVTTHSVSNVKPDTSTRVICNESNNIKRESHIIKSEDEIHIIDEDVSMHNREQKTETRTSSVHSAKTNSEALQSTSSVSPITSGINDITDATNSSAQLLCTADGIIKLEGEIHIIDEQKDMINTEMDVKETGDAPSIKLKQVKQEPMTRFSEIDIVNLSDDEDDVFPCSQLFDTVLSNTDENSEEKQIIKEEYDHDNSNFEPDDVIISLTDSEDEDNTWLHRLSRSQIMSDTDETTATIQIKSEPQTEMEIDAADDDDDIETRRILKDILNDPEVEMETDAVGDPENNAQKTAVEVRDKSPPVVNDISTDANQTAERIEMDDANHSAAKSSETENSLFNKSTEHHDLSSEKSTSHVKQTLKIIEPQPLRTGRRTSDGSSSRAKHSPKAPRSKSSTKKKSAEKEQIEKYTYSKEQKHRRMLYKWANCLPPTAKKKEPISLTKEEKIAILHDRKEKLKKLAIEEKKASSDNLQVKRSAKPKAKVSQKTRSDFLVEAQQAALSKTSKSTIEENAEKSKSKKSSETTDKADVARSNKEVQNKIPKKTVDKVAKDLKNSLKFSDTIKNIKIKKRTSSKDDSRTMNDLKEQFSNQTLNDTNENTNQQQIREKKKRVSFKKNLVTVHEYEIECQHELKKVVGKDAPIPLDKLPVNTPTATSRSYPKLEEFMLRIFSWNPVWLEEQKRLNSIPPVVRENELRPMVTHYLSFQEYYNTALPLLLLEIWGGITKEFENMDNNKLKRRTMMCSIVQNSISHSAIPFTNLVLSNLMIEVLVTKEEMQKQAYPSYGDLVFFEYVKHENGKQTFHKVFAYITDIYRTVLTPLTHYNKDLKNYVKNGYALVTYTLITRPLEENLLVNRIQRLRAVTYLRADLRMIQALLYLPQSPLLNMILNPVIDAYKLPPMTTTKSELITKDKLNKKQLEAVVRVTAAVIQKEPKLCFIQGPPGTGKSKVIVNIVTQILYGDNRYRNKLSLRILVCAPSNAAIDEIVLRLLDIRSRFSERRFKMVRIGRPECMHPSVKDISITELAKRDIRRTTECYSSKKISTNTVEEEKRSLEASINALRCSLTSGKVDESYKRHVHMKLADMTAKYELLKNRKRIDEMTPRHLEKLQRAAENRLLEGADVIACTLSSCYTTQMEAIFGCGNREKISVCIVDEATQSCEAETLIPLMLGVKTLVLVGDPNQLPATVLSQQAKTLGLDQSLFSRVQKAFDGQRNNPIIMLDTQYRMEYPISYWPNKHFYNGKLKNAATASPKFPFHAYRVLNLNSSQNEDKFSNTNEAEFVSNIIFSMLTLSKLENWESTVSLGILTPYNNQRSLMLGKINEKVSIVKEEIRNKLTIEVNTVDGFQGQERDVIIMSCVRSQGIGFLSDKQRLCVALTRAKHSLILCGNFNTFMKDPMWHALICDAKSRGIYITVNATAKPREIKPHIIR